MAPIPVRREIEINLSDIFSWQRVGMAIVVFAAFVFITFLRGLAQAAVPRW